MNPGWFGLPLPKHFPIAFAHGVGMRIADKMSGKEPLQVSVLGNLAVQRHRTRIELPP
jgi:hypothetical protein